MADLQSKFCARADRTAMLPCYGAKGRYYLPLPNGNVFAVNLTGEKDRLRMVCGILYRPTPRDLDFVREFGAPDCLCRARIGHPVQNENDLALAYDAAYDFYFAVAEADLCDIRQSVEYRRRAFVRHLNTALRKQGFCKRGEQWIGADCRGIFPVWRLSFTRDDHLSLCFARTPDPRAGSFPSGQFVRAGEKTDFDWQILSSGELDAIIEQALVMTDEEMQKHRCE